MHGDLSVLAARATTLHLRAQEARTAAQEIQRRVGGAGWRSVAGNVFDGRLSGLGREHLQAARALDEAAAALEEHVRAVEHTQALIAAAERWVTSRVVAEAGDGGSAPGPLPRLPQAGSRDWLDLAARLRAQGW